MFSLLPRFQPFLLPTLLFVSSIFSGGVADNSPPVAADDSYTIHGSGAIGSVLANDSDADHDPISPDVVTFPTHGRLFGTTNGSWNYSPNDLSYTGTDSFTYRACDFKACSNVATVTIILVNQPPIANDDVYNVHGSTLVGPFLINDSDPDGDPLTCGDFTHECILTFPHHGSLFGQTQPDRKSYAPTVGYLGPDSFTYNACDSLRTCTPATVNLNVRNSAPVAVNDTYTLSDGSGIIGPLLINDYDPDGDHINPAPEVLAGPSHGVLIGLEEPDKKIYVPNQGFNGTDTFTYRIQDDLSAYSSPATVTLQVGAVPTPTPTPTPTATPTPPPPPPPPPPSPTPTPTPMEPLIFIPGIAGSHLVDSTNNRELWPGVGTSHNSLTLDPDESPNRNIIATDVIRRVQTLFGITLQTVYAPLLEALTSRGDFREYLVNNNPARRTAAGCDLSQKRDDPAANPNLFVFAYDWRKGNKESADELKDYVGCVQKFHPNSKVNIVAHSMGGLLARRYILENPGKVKKLITIASPWVGTPKGIYVLETGDGDFSFLLIWNSTLRRLARFFPAIHELMPSQGYYDLGGLPFAEQGDFNRNGVSNETYTYTQQTDLLDSRYPRTGSRPGSTNLTLHEFPGQDDWQGDNSNVEYHHIFGEQFDNHTIGQVIAKRETICSIQSDLCYDKEYFFPQVTNGDGTVTKRSALRKGFKDGTPVNLNARGAKFWYLFAQQVSEDMLVEHNGMTKIRPVHDLVLFLLDKGPDPGIPFTARNSPERRNTQSRLARANKGSRAPRAEKPMAHSKRNAAFWNGRFNSGDRLSMRNGTLLRSGPNTEQASDEIPEGPKAPGYFVTILGTDFVSVTDDQGNTNTQLDEMFALPVPNVSYHLLGEKAVFLSMPASQTYTMTFRAGSEPITLEALTGLDNVSPTDAVRYRDIFLPEGVTAMLKVTSSGVETLRYDSDGDGEFETKVTPTVTLSGSAAADVTPPNITISGGPQQTKLRITVNAQDPGSGAKAPRYSLDGTHYQSYSGPFLVDPLQVRTVYAFADDNNANRSALMEYAVPQPPNITAPQHLIVNTNPEGTGCGATISDEQLGSASASSNSQGTVVITRTDIPSGNLFPVGTTTVTYSATDSNGLMAIATQDVTVIDKTPPSLTCPANVVAFLTFNSAAISMNVNFSVQEATDGCSGSIAINSVPKSGSVFQVGTTPVHVTATDTAGNSTSCDFTVTLMYNFGGFFSPVGNLPTINMVDAGRAIPMKFTLNGNKGFEFLAPVPNNPGSGFIGCDSSAPAVDLMETLSAGNSSLSYEAASDQYKYIWKTDSSWAGTCRQFVIQFKDGSVHRANFKFK